MGTSNLCTDQRFLNLFRILFKINNSLLYTLIVITVFLPEKNERNWVADSLSCDNIIITPYYYLHIWSCATKKTRGSVLWHNQILHEEKENIFQWPIAVAGGGEANPGPLLKAQLANKVYTHGNTRVSYSIPNQQPIYWEIFSWRRKTNTSIDTQGKNCETTTNNWDTEILKSLQQSQDVFRTPW